MHVLNIRVTKKELAQIKKEAKKEGISQAAVIRNLIREKWKIT